MGVAESSNGWTAAAPGPFSSPSLAPASSSWPGLLPVSSLAPVPKKEPNQQKSPTSLTAGMPTHIAAKKCTCMHAGGAVFGSPFTRRSGRTAGAQRGGTVREQATPAEAMRAGEHDRVVQQAQADGAAVLARQRIVIRGRSRACAHLLHAGQQLDVSG